MNSPTSLPRERIGTCEICGRLDHHLVAGVCPVCAAPLPAVAPRTHDNELPIMLRKQAD